MIDETMRQRREQVYTIKPLEWENFYAFSRLVQSDKYGASTIFGEVIVERMEVNGNGLIVLMTTMMKIVDM